MKDGAILANAGHFDVKFPNWFKKLAVEQKQLE